MNRKKQGTVRIIGGRWRGRRLPVPDLPGLRPSGDRSRETLFNWLAPYLHGARCADLFAGTGVLGFEAASRGAQSVVLAEKGRLAVKAIRESLELLVGGSAEVEVVHGDALAWLGSLPPDSLDIVFADPPFGMGLEEKAMAMLAESKQLVAGGLVYLETARQADRFEPGPAWKTVKEKAIGDVLMRLLKKS